MFPNPFHQVPAPWGRLKLVKDKDGTIILDNRQIHLEELSSPVRGKVAYIGGIKAKSFSKFCDLVKAERMDFFEMRVDDISALTRVSGLRHLAIRWNTKLEKTVLLRRLRLRSLILEDTPRIRDLKPIGQISELKYFEFSGGMWSKNTASSLAPLSKLPNLTHLVLLNLKVEAGGLAPLANCKRLKKLELSNQFPTEDYAFLSARLPATKCSLFTPWVATRLYEGSDKDVMVVGSRKRFLNSVTDRARIERYEREFARLQAKFASSNARLPRRR